MEILCFLPEVCVVWAGALPKLAQMAVGDSLLWVGIEGWGLCWGTVGGRVTQ